MPRLKGPKRREQLIEVATHLFAKHGFDATTTAAIAAAAGITEPVLYRHFASKQEMFIAIVREMTRHSRDRWKNLIEGESNPAEKMRRIGESYREHIQSLADAYKVIQGAIATSNDLVVLDVIREHYREVVEMFVPMITAGQKEGIFRKDLDPEAVAWMLINIGTGYALVQLNLNIEKPLIPSATDLIIRGLHA